MIIKKESENMRAYDIARVPNGPYNAYPVKDLQEMSLEEVKNKYIKNCAKANGNISVCSKCKTPCPEGRRAIQLIANEVYNDPPIPLYGGKTLIEKAREENMKRKAEKENAKEDKTVTKKDKRIFIENWYEKAMASEDPIAWIMEAYKISKTKAKQKIYSYRNYHPEVKEQSDKILQQKKPEKKVDEEKEVKVEIKDSSFENKFEALMKLQDQHKKAMDEYYRLYEEAKAEYEKIKKKTDTICSAIDILNEI